MARQVAEGCSRKKNNGPNSTNYLNWKHQSFRHRLNLLWLRSQKREIANIFFFRPLWCFFSFTAQLPRQICGRRNTMALRLHTTTLQTYFFAVDLIMLFQLCVSVSIPTQTTGKYLRGVGGPGATTTRKGWFGGRHLQLQAKMYILMIEVEAHTHTFNSMGLRRIRFHYAGWKMYVFVLVELMGKKIVRIFVNVCRNL
jgi:hypothetical protein